MGPHTSLTGKAGLWHITSINADLLPFPDQLHSVPIAQMGNYQDFLKSAPQPLRDADPEQPKRLHTFGNPFKLDKKASDRDLCSVDGLQLQTNLCPLTFSQGMMIDEADEFVTGPQSKGKRPGDSNSTGGGGPKRRRCMSPLLRLGRAYTPPVTPPASPRPAAGGRCINLYEEHNYRKIRC